MAAVVIASLYFYIKSEIKKPVDSKGVSKNFTVSQGEGVNQVGDNLEREGLIKSSIYFKFYVWEKNLRRHVKAGNYSLSPKMDIPQIVDIITEGKVVGAEITILIPEGLTAKEIDKILADNNLVKEGEFVEAIKSESVRKHYPAYEFLKDKPSDKNLEGYLFPDTYKFYKDSIPEDIVGKMLVNFDARLTPAMRQEIAKGNEGMHKTLILASIIQEEVRDPADMKIVAGIFTNRLNIGQALQADSTVNFITGKKMSQALLSDLVIDSPYNTYKYPGLPPGPISNPGIDAIKAAISPEKTPYFYFLTTPEGKVIYSKTYEEHLRNKAKYL